MNEPIFNEKHECIGSVQCTDEFRPGNKEYYSMYKFGKHELWTCIDPTCPLMVIHPHSGAIPSVGIIKVKKPTEITEFEKTAIASTKPLSGIYDFKKEESKCDRLSYETT